MPVQRHTFASASSTVETMTSHRRLHRGKVGPIGLLGHDRRRPQAQGGQQVRVLQTRQPRQVRRQQAHLPRDARVGRPHHRWQDVVNPAGERHRERGGAALSQDAPALAVHITSNLGSTRPTTSSTWSATPTPGTHPTAMTRAQGHRAGGALQAQHKAHRCSTCSTGW